MIALLRRIYSFAGIFIVAGFVCLILTVLGYLGAKSSRKSLQTATYRMALKLWGMRLEIKGALEEAPALLVANHCSYLDIPILGALGAMRFTPKSDVRSWPVIGVIPPAYDVIYVDRVPGKAKKAQADLLAALGQGERICVFPEGTTNDGRQLKPFKATLFSLAEQWQGEVPLAVQAITIRYVSVDGQPLDDALWDQVAWFGDTDLLSHMWAFAAFRNVHVEVTCHAPITLQAGEGRKELAARTREKILDSLPEAQEKA